jgi:hypothetical protein
MEKPQRASVRLIKRTTSEIVPKSFRAKQALPHILPSAKIYEIPIEDGIGKVLRKPIELDALVAEAQKALAGPPDPPS